MQGFWVLLLAVQIMYSCATISMTKTYHEERVYGEQLSIRLPTGAQTLHFSSVDETQQDVLWTKWHATKKGIVSGVTDNRKFVIHSVTFDDQGTYTVLNFLNRKTSIYLVKVITKRSSQNYVAGEVFSIPLSGLAKDDATLQFINQDFNLTLVDHGSPVGNSHPDYMGRIQLTSKCIELLNVNVSDVGNYTLRDRLNRKVRIISMYLVDHHPGITAGPLAAVLLLLGIPSCICCCCRKKICKKSGQPTINTTAVKFDNQINPPGPPPAYVNPPAPAGPLPAYTPGYAAVGESTVYPPNPAFPPQPPYSGYPATSPAMPPNLDFNSEHSNQNHLYPPASGCPPAQPPQWSGAPYNHSAPAGFAPLLAETS